MLSLAIHGTWSRHLQGMLLQSALLKPQRNRAYIYVKDSQGRSLG